MIKDKKSILTEKIKYVCNNSFPPRERNSRARDCQFSFSRRLQVGGGGDKTEKE